MTRIRGNERSRALAAAILATTIVAGCDDDDDGRDAAYDGPLYAMMTQVYTTDDRVVYLSITNGIDFDQLSLESAREFGGVANFAAVDGRILVSEGLAPVIREFEVSDDRVWTEGRSVSFATYPLEDNANFYAQFLLGDHTAYLPYEGTSRIIWDPGDMTITGTITETSVPLVDGNDYDVRAGGNRNAVRYEGAVMQAFFYTDDDWTSFGDSKIAVYDPVTHLETKVIDVPAPGLSIATQDEQGRTYFSSWDVSPALALYGIGPASQVVRVTEDHELDATFTTDFRSWTDGRYTLNFRYVGNGKAVANVLHHELLVGADFDGPLQPDVYDRIWETGPHWKLWIFDLEAGTAKPVEGITVDTASGSQFAVLDGRTFVFLPYEEWGRSKVYEIDDSGLATERYDTIGDIFKWVRIR